MVKINRLKSAKGNVKRSKRLCRGTGNGLGKTGGKGNNGHKSRSGFKNKEYFEGGQNPLNRRLPKKGFNNIFKKYFQLVNVGDIDKIDADITELDALKLFQLGLIHSEDKPVKILGNGDIKKVVNIKADAFSKSAKEKIEKANGKVEVISRA